ncbi:hypothetical protein SAMD00024442_31_2 [Candidatus Symbiothrix dinenymphae]|nr:hypothetical protein SAMD00024442_31_2 [Candidatus Symbiothrix dinenymphae]
MAKTIFKIHSTVAIALFACSTAVAQTWHIGSPNAADVTATLSGGTLTISGSGAMQDWSEDEHGHPTTPWYLRRGNITAVVITGNVTRIGALAFGNCTNLMSVTINSTSTISIEKSAFVLVDKTKCDLIVPPSALSNYKSDPTWGDFHFEDEPPLEYPINYILNGGHTNNPSLYSTGSADIILQDPTKKGYTFAGWLGGGNTIPAGSRGAKTFTASWRAIIYTITYDLKGGTNNADNPDFYTIEDTPLSLNDPVRDGYTFNGWFDDNNNRLDNNTIPAGTTGNIHLTAQWPKMVSFSSVTRIRYNNLLLVNNDSRTNGGYNFTNCVWSKKTNGVWKDISTELYYSAGDNRTDVLDVDACYKAILRTNGEILETYEECSINTLDSWIGGASGQSSALKIYPNPVSAGSSITIEGIPEGVENIATYDLNGRVVGRAVETWRATSLQTQTQMQIPMPSMRGTYVVKVGEEMVKVIVREE